MDVQTNDIYKCIYGNSVLFLKRGIKEVVSHNDSEDSSLTKETGVVANVFIQMSIELALKCYLIKNVDLQTILHPKYEARPLDSIYDSFKNNTLQTKSYQELKDYIKNNERLTWFNNIDFAHLDQFQLYRNKLVHLNLFLGAADLYDLKYHPMPYQTKSFSQNPGIHLVY